MTGADRDAQCNTAPCLPEHTHARVQSGAGAESARSRVRCLQKPDGETENDQLTCLCGRAIFAPSADALLVDALAIDDGGGRFSSCSIVSRYPISMISL